LELKGLITGERNMKPLAVAVVLLAVVNIWQGYKIGRLEQQDVEFAKHIVLSHTAIHKRLEEHGH